MSALTEEPIAPEVCDKCGSYFDVLAYVAWASDPRTRSERAHQAMMTYPDELNVNQRGFLNFVLGEYVNHGVDELDQEKLPPLLQLKYHAIADAAAELGSAERIRALFVGFQKYLYQPQAGA